MQMLEAGGVEVLSDAERRADDDNPKGYYELEAVKKTREDASWLAQAPGKAVKVISQLLYDLPAGTQGQVLFLRRNMSEILASQRKMLLRRTGAASPPVDDDEMARVFEAHLHEVLNWVRDRDGLELLEIEHANVLEDAGQEAGHIGAALGRELDLPAMAAVVDVGLHRNRGGMV